MKEKITVVDSWYDEDYLVIIDSKGNRYEAPYPLDMRISFGELDMDDTEEVTMITLTKRYGDKDGNQ